VLTSDSITKIMPAFIAAQGAFKPAVKDAVNTAFTRGNAAPKPSYVSLAQAIDSVEGALRDNKIALLQQTDVTDHGGTILITRLIHESGEWIAGRYPVHAVKADPQGEGSALTYARRYALMALVGIAPEDDDGNAAVKAVETAAAKPITFDQEANLRDTLEANGKDVQACCAYFGVATLADLPAEKFAMAIKIAATPKPKAA
jgi:hypothetical protein